MTDMHRLDQNTVRVLLEARDELLRQIRNAGENESESADEINAASRALWELLDELSEMDAAHA